MQWQAPRFLQKLAKCINRWRQRIDCQLSYNLHGKAKISYILPYIWIATLLYQNDCRGNEEKKAQIWHKRSIHANNRWFVFVKIIFPPKTRATSLVFKIFGWETGRGEDFNMADGTTQRWMKCCRKIFSSKHEHQLGRLLLNRLREALSLKEMEVEQEKATVCVFQKCRCCFNEEKFKQFKFFRRVFWDNIVKIVVLSSRIQIGIAWTEVWYRLKKHVTVSSIAKSQILVHKHTVLCFTSYSCTQNICMSNLATIPLLFEIIPMKFSPT